jgi:membrane-associated phospholipid phosphatase
MFVVRLLAAVTLGCLAAALALHGTDTDRRWFQIINEAGYRWATPALLSGITLLGNGLAATMLMSPALLSAPKTLCAALYSAPVALLLSRAPKALLDSPRPAAVLDPAAIHVDGMLLAGHNSFPSGHTLTAFLLVAVLLTAQDAWRPKWYTSAAIVLFGVAVAISRIGVGAHWPSDVLGGAALGLAAGLAGSWISRRAPIPTGRFAQATLALLLLVSAVLFSRANTGYPLARPMQWLLAALGAGVSLIALIRLRGRSQAQAREVEQARSET